MTPIRTSVFVDGDWLEIPLPPPVDDKVVYHYTSAVGLIGILESNRLWASSPMALNDLSELEYGIRVLQRVWEATKAARDLSPEQIEIVDGILSTDNLRDAHSSVYVVCASEMPDSLNQWQNYGAPPGYALAIQTGHDLAVVVPSELAKAAHWASVGTRMHPGWYKVLYEEPEQLRAAQLLVDFVLDNPGLWAMPDRVSDFVAPLVPQLKDPAFAAECEVRYIAQNLSPIPEKFRDGPFGVVPYIDIGTSESRHQFVVESACVRLPIVGLTCGPVNQGESELVKSAAKRLLSHHGYGGSVASSAVPYRVR